jgi:putative ABC transport system permease protein
MLKHYFKIALRNARKNTGYSLLNATGLAIGMACCLFILLYVKDELSYDRFHEKGDRIYRITSRIEGNDNPTPPMPLTIFPIATTLLQDYPAVEQAVRIKKDEVFVSREAIRFYENDFIFADASFFEIFTFPLKKGDPAKALTNPYSVVLSEETAQKYFGSQDPLGQSLTLNDTLECLVTGVLSPMPSNSHLTFDLVASLETLLAANRVNLQRQFLWWSFNYYTYVVLDENASRQEVSRRLFHFGDEYIPDLQERFGREHRYDLQPLREIYLHSNLAFEFGQTSDILYAYVLSGVAGLILVIACINFINMSTARSAQRAREIGMRKTLGAWRSQLVRQLLGESILTAVCAMIMARVLMEFFLPAFNDLSGKELSIDISQDLSLLFGLIGMTLFAGLLAGSYPAFVLSRFKPVSILGAAGAWTPKRSHLRKTLVVFQFAASIVLIVGAIVLSSQLDFMLHKNLGFEQEQIVVIPLHDNSGIRTRYEAVMEEIDEIPQVVNVSASGTVPGRPMPSIVFIPEGADETETQSINTLIADWGFIETFQMQMEAGRDFSRDFETDEQQGFIVNETAVQTFGWGSAEAAVGKEFTWGWPGKRGHIIGVVKDFHHSSLHQRIEPVVLHIQPSWFNYISVRMASQNLTETLSRLEAAWQGIAPDRPFEFFFLDRNLDLQYQNDRRLGNLFAVFSFLAIFIGCLGLFSLASLTLEQRTKEVGIRKVLGASGASIIGLFSKEFVKLVFWANVIAWPIAYFAMRHWLQAFAYPIDLEIGTFAIAGFASLSIALLTISVQSIRAAVANPVVSLWYE